MVGSGPQFHKEARNAWDLVDRKYVSADILSEAPTQEIPALSAQASHHELPIALAILSGLISCTKGARVEVFLGGARNTEIT